MASSANPAARAALVAALDAFISGRVPDEVQLDLLEAAAQCADPAVKEKLAAAEAALTARQRNAFDLTLSGGDPRRGRLVFENQGLCLKCHRITSVGGRAGPKLDELAKRLKPPEILRSLLNPNDVIVDGYGIIAFTLDDGSAVAGTPLEESDTTISMRTPAGSIEKIPKSRIKERSPAISPMPPLGPDPHQKRPARSDGVPADARVGSAILSDGSDTSDWSDPSDESGQGLYSLCRNSSPGFRERTKAVRSWITFSTSRRSAISTMLCM